MPDDPDAPLPTVFRGLNPEELLARGMHSVKVTSAGAVGWIPPTVEEVARLFTGYEVVALIGHGGMGAIYQARQVRLDRMVAIKLLPLEISVDQTFSDRFVREARAMARMEHPNIIAVHDFGNTTEGHLFFAMDFVDGTTLHHLIQTRSVSAPEALAILTQICDALGYAHEEGVIHRDIKPANILIDKRGRVKVADFGLARLTLPKDQKEWASTMKGVVLGTPDYMAPEQRRGKAVDHRVDIYAMGVLLYEMLTGEVPRGVFQPPSQKIGTDKKLDNVIARAIASDVEKRYQTAAELRAALDLVRPAIEKAAGKTKPTAAQGPATRVLPVQHTPAPAPAAGKGTVQWIALGAGLLGLIAAAVWFMTKKAESAAPPVAEPAKVEMHAP